MYRLPPETPRNPEINEATPLLHDEVCVIDAELYAIGGAAGGFADEPIYEAQTDIDNIVETLILAWLPFSPRRLGGPEREYSAFLDPRALHAMSTAWRKIKAERNVLPESEVIVQGLTEYMVDYMYQLQLMVSGGEKHVTEEISTARVAEIMTKRWRQILHGFEDEDKQKRARKKTEIDNIVDTLFLAWLQFPPSRSAGPECEDSEFLGPRALHAMSTAWRKIKTERDILPESEVIVQGLTESMVDYMYQLQLRVPEGKEQEINEAFTEHVTKIVAEGWQQILDGIEKDEQERAREKRERRQRIRERVEKRREVAEVLWFYEPFARMNHYVPLDCRIFCINLCLCCSVFIFQVLITILLLPWPLSMGIMGGLYMTQCPMSYFMPYVMMAIGVAGTIALLIRLSFAIYEKFSGNKMNQMCLWILLKVIEFAFLDFLSVHLYYFFSKTPSFVLGSPEYCNETFYNFVYLISYVSIALASLWLLVYFIKGILTWQLRKYSLRPW